MHPRLARGSVIAANRSNRPPVPWIVAPFRSSIGLLTGASTRWSNAAAMASAAAAWRRRRLPVRARAWAAARRWGRSASLLGELGGDGVEEEVQDELERRVAVLLAATGIGPLEVGVAAGGQLLLDVGGDRRQPLLSGHAGAPLDLLLGQLALDEPDDEEVHRRPDRPLGLQVDAQAAHGGRRELVLAQGVGAQRWRAKGNRCQPWVAKEHRAGVPREGGQVRPPVARRLQGVLAGDLVAHQLDELVLAAHVPVQRHRAGTERFGDAAHGEGVQPVAVGDGDRGPHDLLARKAAHAPARWALGAGPHQVKAIPTPGTAPLGCRPAGRSLAWATRATASASLWLFHRWTSRVGVDLSYVV